ncbi:MAG TPA: type II secretion system F family protein [Anaerolineae bacterium]|nr:type II secretion system F family protein [Anaerolineae bacterium]
MMLPLLAGLLVTLSILCIWQGLRAARPSEDILEKLEQVSGTPQQLLEEVEFQASFFERAVKPLLRRLVAVAGRLVPQRNVERLRRDLTAAGNPYGLSITDVLGIKFLAAFAAAVLSLPLLGSASGGLMRLLGLALIPLGFYLPNLWLRRRISARKAEIIRALPDALDMLTVCVDAGLGFDAALLKIGEKWQNALAEEFGRTVAEMRVGVTRAEALRNMAARCDVPDVSNFVAVLIQADQLGLSIAQILRVQAQQLRLRRRQRAEELARQAPIKMLFPLVFLIFPAMFAVIFGPAIPMLIEMFAHISR